jgi:hypothetical protein
MRYADGDFCNDKQRSGATIHFTCDPNEWVYAMISFLQYHDKNSDN